MTFPKQPIKNDGARWIAETVPYNALKRAAYSLVSSYFITRAHAERVLKIARQTEREKERGENQ